jgi:SAM-dependent methyltransferase
VLRQAALSNLRVFAQAAALRKNCRSSANFRRLVCQRFCGSSNQERSELSSPVSKSQCVLPPIAAYDIFASAYSSYAETRRAYLQKVEEIVIARIAGRGPVAALFDVGAGDGRRALRIARSAGVGRVVLLEPSAGMRAQCPEGVEIWPCRISEVPAAVPAFDVITCLWNVLGHLRDSRERELTLYRIGKLLAPRGTVFLDVSHRYNAEAYGWEMTLLRISRNFFNPSERHGDVTITWKVGERTIYTHGHLFTHAEIKGLCRSAGLKIARRWVINYATGEECRLPLSGHLLYQLTAG